MQEEGGIGEELPILVMKNQIHHLLWDERKRKKAVKKLMARSLEGVWGEKAANLRGNKKENNAKKKGVA